MANGISQANKQAFRNPWVLGWIALVTVVFGVNLYMVTTAFVSSPGLVNKDYYEQGRAFERSVQSRNAAKAALGWTLSLDTGTEPHAGKPSGFTLTARDKAGQPLTAAQVVVYAYRPSDAASDFSMPLAEKTPGQYVGDLTFPLKGAWDLIVEVKQGENSYSLPRRISIFGD